MHCIGWLITLCLVGGLGGGCEFGKRESWPEVPSDDRVAASLAKPLNGAADEYVVDFVGGYAKDGYLALGMVVEGKKEQAGHIAQAIALAMTTNDARLAHLELRTSTSMPVHMSRYDVKKGFWIPLMEMRDFAGPPQTAGTQGDGRWRVYQVVPIEVSRAFVPGEYWLRVLDPSGLLREVYGTTATETRIRFVPELEAGKTVPVERAQ